MIGRVFDHARGRTCEKRTTYLRVAVDSATPSNMGWGKRGAGLIWRALQSAKVEIDHEQRCPMLVTNLLGAEVEMRLRWIPPRGHSWGRRFASSFREALEQRSR